MRQVSHCNTFLLICTLLFVTIKSEYFQQVWFQNKRNRTKKVPAPGEQSVKRPWEDDEGESRDCKRSRRSSSSLSAVQRCLRMGISHEEIDSMCVVDNTAFSEAEGEFVQSNFFGTQNFINFIYECSYQGSCIKCICFRLIQVK